jgi:hypothetical protein
MFSLHRELYTITMDSEQRARHEAIHYGKPLASHPLVTHNTTRNTADDLPLTVSLCHPAFHEKGISTTCLFCAFIDLLSPLPLHAMAVAWGKRQNW